MTAKKQDGTQSRMCCWNCSRYSRTERRCHDGKANPKKKSDTVEVATHLGLRALCHYNPYRDGLALRMHFPATLSAIASVEPGRRRSRRPVLEPADVPAAAPPKPNSC